MRIEHHHGIFFVICLMAAGVVRAEEDDWTATAESFICRSSNEVRQIKTYVSRPPEGGVASAPGCRVDYVKNGATQIVWSSHSSRSSCNGKASQLAARLKAGNFSCDALHPQRSEGP